MTSGSIPIQWRIGDGTAGPQVRLSDGQVLHPSLVLLATGVRPAVDFLANSGVETDVGVLAEFTSVGFPESQGRLFIAYNMA